MKILKNLEKNSQNSLILMGFSHFLTSFLKKKPGKSKISDFHENFKFLRKYSQKSLTLMGLSLIMTASLKKGPESTLDYGNFPRPYFKQSKGRESHKNHQKNRQFFLISSQQHPASPSFPFSQRKKLRSPKKNHQSISRCNICFHVFSIPFYVYYFVGI
jgi:hypothetical protein